MKQEVKIEIEKFKSGKIASIIPRLNNGQIYGLFQAFCGNGSIHFHSPHKNKQRQGARVEFKYISNQ